MTRGKKSPLRIPNSVQRTHVQSMNMMRGLLQGDQTGNFGLVHSDGRADISEIRNQERHLLHRFDDPRVMLPNPTADAPFDRTEPQSKRAKNEAFGFETQPDRIIDLPPGDAGAGQSMYRRTHVFSRLNATTAPTAPVAGNPFNEAIAMATYRSSDCRPRFWHISFFGIGVQRVAGAGTLGPLDDSEILSRQLEPVSNNVVPTGDFVPAISQLKGRVLVFDESGGRYYDVDVLGNRSLDVYAWGVTAFILAPKNEYEGFPLEPAYEVNTSNGGVPTPEPEYGGLVEDSIMGVRIVPIIINSTQNKENRTITAVTPELAAGAAIEGTRIPIPPGTLKVQVFCQDGPAAAAGFTLRFDAGNDGTFAGRTDLGILDIPAGQSKTELMLVPNCAQIIIRPNAAPSPSVGWSFVFVVESQ